MGLYLIWFVSTESNWSLSKVFSTNTALWQGDTKRESLFVHWLSSVYFAIIAPDYPLNEPAPISLRVFITVLSIPLWKVWLQSDEFQHRLSPHPTVDKRLSGSIICVYWSIKHRLFHYFQSVMSEVAGCPHLTQRSIRPSRSEEPLEQIVRQNEHLLHFLSHMLARQ